MKKGLLIVVSGPSGVGKGTVCKALIEKKKDIFLSVSATTRSPREGEREGINYYYLSAKDFSERISKGGFLEYARYVDNYYGTPKEEVFQKLEQGIDVLLEIELQGALQVKETCPEALFVFLLPPDMKVLQERIVNRGTEDEKTIEKRMLQAREELKYIEKYDYMVINEKLQRAVEETLCIIEAEKHRIERNHEMIAQIRRSL